MGCDIHIHAEVKIEGQWHHYGILRADRNYALFARLANVRNDEEDPIPPIAEPRGIPADATFLTMFDVKKWDGDGHSHSWINADEIASLPEWVKGYAKKNGFDVPFFWESNQFGFLFGNNWSDFRNYPDSFPAGLEDIRFIFFFDN